mmetsp:Transcript_7784/g.18961  ORF Transcript_7784/g.18961 Transcript_7784/m.18961 type:complete len:285 (+) Transcript_7784:674-1528(+)
MQQAHNVDHGAFDRLCGPGKKVAREFGVDGGHPTEYRVELVHHVHVVRASDLAQVRLVEAVASLRSHHHVDGPTPTADLHKRFDGRDAAVGHPRRVPVRRREDEAKLPAPVVALSRLHDTLLRKLVRGEAGPALGEPKEHGGRRAQRDDKGADEERAEHGGPARETQALELRSSLLRSQRVGHRPPLLLWSHVHSAWCHFLKFRNADCLSCRTTRSTHVFFGARALRATRRWGRDCFTCCALQGRPTLGQLGPSQTESCARRLLHAFEYCGREVSSRTRTRRAL